jgi:EmrB/QacA subfamily drug resistance transporter
VIQRLQGIPYKWLVATVFVIALFMDLLDITIVNVALPTLGREFAADNTTLEWVVTAYLLSLAVWIPASGWLGDRYGTKRLFLFALAMFTLGSALCGAAWSIQSLIAFRVLQGVGGGMLTPVGTTMLFRAFPPNERAQASGVLFVPTAIAPALGPILGGWLVDNPGWRWIFYVNLPIGLLGFATALVVLREHKEERSGRFDVAGFLLAAVGLPLVLYALSQAPHAGWTSARVLTSGLGGLAVLALLVVVELRTTEPMLALRLFGDRMFRNGNLAGFMLISGLIGIVFLLPLFLQQLRGLSAFDSGLTTFPQAIGFILIVRPAANLYARIGPRRMVAAGMAGTAISTALFLAIGLDSSLWWIRAIMFLRGLSLGFALIAIQAAMYSRISRHDTGRASALFNTNRQVASSFGVAILATVLTDRTATRVSDALRSAAPATREAAARHSTVAAYHDAYLAGVIIALIGLALAFLIHDEDAAASMRPQLQPVAAVERAASEEPEAALAAD